MLPTEVLVKAIVSGGASVVKTLLQASYNVTTYVYIDLSAWADVLDSWRIRRCWRREVRCLLKRPYLESVEMLLSTAKSLLLASFTEAVVMERYIQLDERTGHPKSWTIRRAVNREIGGLTLLVERRTYVRSNQHEC
jgi:hypothetical protein